MATRVIVIKDNVAPVFKALQQLTGKAVLVGIPQENADRDDDQPINNAALGYIHEFGSPQTNLPARPFLLPGVDKAKLEALTLIRKAAVYALACNTAKSDAALAAAGQVAADTVRSVFHDNNWPPLSPETVANRYRQRGDKTQRPAEIKYAALIAAGQSPSLAQSTAGILPLINTGELMRSITYVVRTK